MVAVAVEGAVAVVADMVAGARLCLALIYVWKRRGEGQSCAKGMGCIWHGQGRRWRGHSGGGGQLWGWLKLGHEGISNACSHAAVVLPPLVPKAAGWQMPPHSINSCTASPSCPPCFGLAGTRAVSVTGHPRKQHPCSQGSTAAPGSGRWVGTVGCRPRCLQVLTQALAGSGIKGVEARAAAAGVGPGGVGAELAAVVQALSTLVDVWWWGRERHGVTAGGGKAAQPCCCGVGRAACCTPAPPVLHICLCFQGRAGAELPRATMRPPASSWPGGRESWGMLGVPPPPSPLPMQPHSRVGRSIGKALPPTAQQAGLIDRI